MGRKQQTGRSRKKRTAGIPARYRDPIDSLDEAPSLNTPPPLEDPQTLPKVRPAKVDGPQDKTVAETVLERLSVMQAQIDSLAAAGSQPRAGSSGSSDVGQRRSRPRERGSARGKHSVARRRARLPSGSSTHRSDVSTPRSGRSRTNSRASSVPDEQPIPKKRKRRDSRSPSVSSSGETGDLKSGSEDSDEDFSSYDKPTQSFGSLIGSHVSSKLKRKILSNRFLEMSELLPQYHFRNPEALILVRGKSDSAEFLPKKTKAQIPFDQWQEAFDIYTAVYIEKARTVQDVIKLARSLLTYKKEINNIRRRNDDWSGYDRHFRHDREGDPISWATTRHDLLTHYRGGGGGRDNFRAGGAGGARDNFRTGGARDNFRASSGNVGSPSTTQTLKTKDGNSVPYGYCVAYHTKDGRCTNGKECPFLHKCPLCGGSHPVFLPCVQRRQTQVSANTKNFGPAATKPTVTK